jgi:tetratricopeptide repeat protein 21B
MKSKRLQICRIQTNIAARQSVDQQISELNDFLKTSPHYVPALLALANAFLAQRQGSKARSVLKTIIKLEWSMAHADDYERSLLLFGELMIKDSKLDLAQECFNKCILHNQSCAKAYEYLGYLYDKQALYGEAVELYEKAWKFENESDPSIGYRLAFNYYKQRMFTDAIDVANKILAKFPSYPKIRKEILEKARQSLRPL